MEALSDIVALKPAQFWALIVLFLPGFISLKLHQFIERRTAGSVETFTDVVGFSLLNAFVLWWPIYIATTHLSLPKPDYWVALQNAFWVCIVGPAVWPILFQRIKRFILNAGWLAGAERSAFDFAFHRKETRWVIVHLKGGQLVGGYFGLQSYATAEADSGHLYLEELWRLDAQGRFVSAISGSKGAIFRPEDYDWIEVFQDGPSNGSE